MKITDLQVLQLADPVQSHAAGMGTRQRWWRWGGTIVKVFTDEDVGPGSPGHGVSPLIES
jgi:hypothetical protein